MNPRTKYIALKYHHFRSFMQKSKTELLWIKSEQQIADIFTKPLKEMQFEYLRGLLCGW